MHTRGDNCLPHEHFCKQPPNGLEPLTCGLQNRWTILQVAH